jgi:hypothetical protein
MASSDLALRNGEEYTNAGVASESRLANCDIFGGTRSILLAVCITSFSSKGIGSTEDLHEFAPRRTLGQHGCGGIKASHSQSLRSRSAVQGGNCGAEHRCMLMGADDTA